ncbi:MAG: tripartite tricarboxylate transporter substrate binding protein, partial [Betaproteobacteria bacterium]|nr:tripartite tricarboxylate transporter substrate binding protein [Betaproteobacteria bacterium]
QSVADAYQKMGMVPGSGSADELTRFYLQDVQRWPQVVKQSGAKIE